MKGLIYCEECGGYTEYTTFEVEMKDGTFKEVTECSECETWYHCR